MQLLTNREESIGMLGLILVFELNERKKGDHSKKDIRFVAMLAMGKMGLIEFSDFSGMKWVPGDQFQKRLENCVFNLRIVDSFACLGR